MCKSCQSKGKRRFRGKKWKTMAEKKVIYVQIMKITMGFFFFINQRHLSKNWSSLDYFKINNVAITTIITVSLGLFPLRRPRHFGPALLRFWI